MHDRTRTEPVAEVDIEADEERFERGGPRWRRALHVLAPLLVLAAGAGVAWLLVRTAPEPEREAPGPAVALVDAVRARAVEGRPVLAAFGQVEPARRVELAPEIEGVVAAISPRLVPGGFFAAGETMLVIDDRELRLAVAAQEAAIADAQVALARERAEQIVAERALALFPEDARAATEEGAELARREPQVRAAREQLEAARSALARARLDLERTEIEAPFDCVVIDATIDEGQRVGPLQPGATLAGVDAHHVEVSVPVASLPWVRTAQPGGGGGSRARVRVRTPAGEGVWEAHVGPLAAQVTERGRMARLLVVAPDPLGLRGDGGPREVPLLLGSFVEVEILAEPIEGAVTVPRAALREGEVVWIASEVGSLEVRAVDVAWTDEERVLLQAGVEPGERVITSRIGAPVPGMRVRVAQDEEESMRRMQASLDPRRAR